MSSDTETVIFREFLRAMLDESLRAHAPTNRNVKELWQHWNSYTLRVINRLDKDMQA